MARTTHPQGTPTVTAIAGSEKRPDVQRRRRIGIILWFIGLIIFAVSCVIIHAHPQPYPIDLETTHTIQGLPTPSWLVALIELPSNKINNPVPAAIILAAWFVGLLLVGLISYLRKLPTAGWFQTAIFLALTVMSSAGINVLLDEIIGRPRPNPKVYHTHLYTPLVPFPTYPSGHTEHDMVYYGFLLYLSFTRPVREWRYRWLLIPFQLFAVCDIIVVGYSRILEGDHWLTDILGGYLEGALELCLFIFLYRLTTDWLAKRREKKRVEKLELH
jgi:membrane-associated phospholipid phosphatase